MDGPKLLKAWRDGAELSQKAVADAAGVGQPTVAEWEADNRRPEFSRALALEDLSDGAVRVEAWGYERSLIDAARGAIARREADHEREVEREAIAAAIREANAIEDLTPSPAVRGAA